MKIIQGKKIKDENWKFNSKIKLKEPLVLIFGNRYLLENKKILKLS